MSEKALTGFFRQGGNVRAIFSEFCEIQRELPFCHAARTARRAAHLRDKRDFFRRTCRRKKYRIGKGKR